MTFSNKALNTHFFCQPEAFGSGGVKEGNAEKADEFVKQGAGVYKKVQTRLI